MAEGAPGDRQSLTSGFLRKTTGDREPFNVLQVDYSGGTKYLGNFEMYFVRSSRGYSREQIIGDVRLVPEQRFPLYPVAHFKDSFSKEAVAEGDCFLPMYRKSHSNCSLDKVDDKGQRERPYI